jgi:hypothetical protein
MGGAMTIMVLSSDEVIFLIVFLTAFGAYCAWRTYIAWYVPDQHKTYMDVYGGFFAKWPFGIDRYWNSKFNFELLRVLFPVGFLFAIGAIIFIIANLI